MNADKKNLGKYLSLVKKVADWKIKDPTHYDIKEDVVQEAFIKLLRAKFFSRHEFDDEQAQKKITNYISRTVHSCYMDQLNKLGYNRRLTNAERKSTGNIYENIRKDQIGDVLDKEETLCQTDTPDQYVLVKEAYQWIKHCFDRLSAGISNLNKKRFFHAAFWRLEDYGLPIKNLAEQLSYSSANPTRDLKHFTSKVSQCTTPHGVVVTNPGEQIQFLLEQIENSEAVS